MKKAIRRALRTPNNDTMTIEEYKAYTIIGYCFRSWF